MQPLLLLLSLSTSGSGAGPVNFDKTVAPLLAGRCLDCHSGADRKGGLDLSTSQGLHAGGDSGPVVDKKPSESLLVQRVNADEMPPKHPLPLAERAILQKWIEEGAAWGSDPIDPYRYSTSTRAGSDWWAFQKLNRPALKPGRANLIDGIVRAKLVEKKLTPSPAADPRTLIRRVFFDLIGLPPTPAEVEAFARDASPEAYAKLVDRLLRSPHYGERWARHWLDVSRFGESDGYEFDKLRPNAWRFRDWVIQALNDDMPYDRFAKLQIAGDVLEPANPSAIVASGFLVCGAHDSLQPAGDVMKQIMRQDELEDLVGVVGQTFLGMTVNCARCHDHKFDPIRQSDYFRFAAALSGVRRGDRALPVKPPAELADKIDELRKNIAALEMPARERVLQDRKTSAKLSPQVPKPFASWDFSRDLRDTVGGLHGRAIGTAKLTNGALQLDGKGHVETGPLPVSVLEKSLEAWVKLDNPDQRGGGVIGIRSPDGGVFDCVVYGEREPRRWMAGSESFRRTQAFQGAEESQAHLKYVHVAITYAADGTVTAYRDGVPYGKSYRVEQQQRFEKSSLNHVVFGLRHLPAGGNKHLTGSILRANLYTQALSATEVAASALGEGYVSVSDLEAKLSGGDREKRKRLLGELATAEVKMHDWMSAKAFAVTPQPPPVTHRLKRGNPQEKAELITAGGLSVLKSSDFGLPVNAPEADSRRRLAEWIADKDNPLFARTIVNRVWQYHFGRGLVDTPNDLGFNGGQPSHPELLDGLAAEFIARKWSLKELHRLIVTSDTYRQASVSRPEAMAVDADNRLLWRVSPRRLEAEAVRDATLAVAGRLNPAVGGPGYRDVRPYIFRTSQFYEPLDPEGPESNRRSVYRLSARGGKNSLLDTFDCADPSTPTPKRAATTTPLQALSLMNGSFTLRMADHLAARLRAEGGSSTDDQIRLAFALAYGRPAKGPELTACREVVSKHGLAPFCRALLNTNGFLYVH